jgi:hypothetical protein
MCPCIHALPQILEKREWGQIREMKIRAKKKDKNFDTNQAVTPKMLR